MTEPSAEPRHARPGTSPRRRRIATIIAGGVAVVLVAAAGVAVWKYVDLSNGIRRSAVTMPTGSANPGVAQNTGESNILIMGLDSRVDQNGKPLPQEIYDAIRAGDQSDGGYNANVLMFIHIPANGGKASGISIPRDDYASLSGSPDGVARSKIKEAYGLALDEKLRELRKQGVAEADAYQQARTAARQTQIQTVSDFLGGVRIDHFVEITMGAFYEIAKAVQPITVCLNHATQDRFSGADFQAGVQQIDASQAMSFVRQRRDTGPTDLELTDLDRTRRQQAFIVSLAVQLRQAKTFTDFGTLQSLIDTAKTYIAVDDGLDLLSFASQAQRLSGGNIDFQTLPVERYESIDGKSVNIVDLAKIRAIVDAVLNPPTTKPEAPATAGPTAAPTPTDPATPELPANTYTDSATPLQSGAIPCVN
ncbi:LCP family protein [Leifsonia shinshuensis]|uniref:LCP family protein n=1 Tax=Leifsonia shinshuensis TaxID=150026 RepID=UPI001F50BB1C|nr:LCP family protein [Leifsonia shinshuensis]MCI0157813.1 LCP family protein [Leifsonia shinshuensis]